MVLSSLLLLTALASCASLAQLDIPLSQPLQSLLTNYPTNLTTYPTQLTREIIPKAFHSHNDYWRPVPFYSALSVGAVSVEADVWLVNGTLHVSQTTTTHTEPAILLAGAVVRRHYSSPPGRP